MVSPRRLTTLLTVVPVTGGVMAALLACAPTPAPAAHHGPAPARHAAPVQPETASASQSSSPWGSAGKNGNRILNHLVTLSAERVTLNACLPFQPPTDPLLGGLPSRPAPDLNTQGKTYKDLRSLCTTYRDRLNTLDARLTPIAQQARPILATRRGEQELEPIMDRIAEEFHFNPAQRAALPFAVAVATGVHVVQVG